MRVLITGAGGSLGTALAPALEAEYDLVLSDVEPVETDHEFVRCDVRDPAQVRAATEDVDAVVHTPAWHGVHTDERTEREFWELNVGGTFNALSAAVEHGVEKFVFLSSQAARAGIAGKYAFTKVVGEQTCEYAVRNHEEFSAVAVRPAAFAVHTGDRKRYGERLLRNAVDRRDVVGVVAAALETETVDWGVYPAVRDDPYTAAELERWSEDPIAVLENYVPEAGRLVATYDVDLPAEVNPNGGFSDTTMAATRTELGYDAQYDFVSFLEDLRDHDARGDAAEWLAGDV